MVENIYVSDVFTPTKPAKLTFVERDNINNKLVNAITTPGKQVVVYGLSGSGKTTLLINKLNQIYENHITTRCMIGMTYEQIIWDAFDQLSPFYVSEHSSGKTVSVSPKISADYLGIKAEIGAQSASNWQATSVRYLPPQLTCSSLARLLGAAKCCWVLEDFHKILQEDKVKVAQSLKVFMDTADEYPDVKIIAIGAVETAREVIQYDPEMRNRVSEVFVPLMGDEELEKIIIKGQELLNIKFPPNVQRGIVHYSNGLASVCHHFCLNICNAANVVQKGFETVSITDGYLQSAINTYLEETSDTLKSAFDKAFKQRKSKFDNCRLILTTMATFGQDGASHGDIFKKIIKKEPNYPRSNLTQYLGQLSSDTRSNILRFNKNSGKYSFSDPLYRTFILTNLRSHKKITSNELIQTFNQLFLQDGELSTILKDSMAKAIRITITTTKDDRKIK